MAVRDLEHALEDGDVRQAVEAYRDTLQCNWNEDQRRADVYAALTGSAKLAKPSKADRGRARLRDLATGWLEGHKGASTETRSSDD